MKGSTQRERVEKNLKPLTNYVETEKGEGRKGRTMDEDRKGKRE